MDAKHFLIVGGSSGIGLEVVKALHEKGNEVYVGSRTNDQLTELAGVHHLPLDVTVDPLNLEGLPEVLNGIVYCPGTIQLKPFQRLTIDDFLKDLQVNFLGAVRTIQACLSRLRKSKSGSSSLKTDRYTAGNCRFSRPSTFGCQYLADRSDYSHRWGHERFENL